MRIYVASSWRNAWQPAVVLRLRALGHSVYDFRAPAPGQSGFSWSEIDANWKQWQAREYRRNLEHAIAERGFKLDMDALRLCDACILVQPCGTSSHLELGWAVGAGKKTAVLFPHGVTLTSVGGHSVSNAPCSPCGDLDGCHLPGKIHRIEPELMAKMADTILTDWRECETWLREVG